MVFSELDRIQEPLYVTLSNLREDSLRRVSQIGLWFFTAASSRCSSLSTQHRLLLLL
jgi:hypothetical protein